MKEDMKKILILGGTRFLGPALIRKLLEKGGTSLTCFHRGLHMEDRKNENVEHVIGDRKNERDVRELFGTDYDLVIDLSGTEADMIENAMRYARGRCGRYVFVSSSSVYSPDTENPHREDELLSSGTGDSYALAKIRGEEILRESFDHWTVIRPSKVYGPGNYYFREETFLNIIRQDPLVILENDPILHFTYIDDLISGMHALLETDGVFNVAGAEPARLSTFITVIGRLHGITPQFAFGEESSVPFTRLKDRTLDLSRAEKTAGWSPAVMLEEGLRRTFGITAPGGLR
ncbi:MAG: NAD-dependent epimerase/dehydratase family protein [Solobacterium sp.]|nr:NAD-dependent epimerase/dehydratase family protein [Solobacterium sp.]